MSLGARTGGRRAEERTGGPTHRRAGARAAGLALAASLALGAAGPLAAQVGHAPGSSPFRDITMRQALSFVAGRFGGDTAVAGVGWRAGPLYAGRLDTRITGPLDFTASIGFAASSRKKIDTEDAPATRDTARVHRTLVLADIGLTLNLTGAKSWRGIAPYVGLGAGWMAPMGRTTKDPGGYNPGSNFTLVPSLGTRVFLGRRLAARVEVRDYFWRYEWPLRYFAPLDRNGNDITPPILATSAKDRQWTHNIALTIGIVYAFNF